MVGVILLGCFFNWVVIFNFFFWERVKFFNWLVNFIFVIIIEEEEFKFLVKGIFENIFKWCGVKFDLICKVVWIRRLVWFFGIFIKLCLINYFVFFFNILMIKYFDNVIFIELKFGLIFVLVVGIIIFILFFYYFENID